MLSRRTRLAFALLLLLAAPARPQGNTTGTITGEVTSEQGALPGATVTAESPQLQRSRSVTSSANGGYLIGALPPGEYTVTFALAGFQTLKQRVRLAAAQSLPLDVRLSVAMGQEISVVAESDPIPSTPAIASNYTAELIEKLPLDRSVVSAVTLAPGVHSTGPAGNISIAGSMSFESLYLVNGVVVNENIRGQSLPLFIEDAIQETTITTGAVSAEFGRFAGGIVSTITKSGGNRFSGSLRTSFSNDDWRATTPFGEPKVDDTVPTYEATFGGPIVKDNLWFFFAGRSRNNTESRQTTFTNEAYDFGDNEKRIEGKLTWSLGSNHTFKGSYTRIARDQKNNAFGTIMDARSLDDRKLPQDLVSLNYSGLVAKDLFIEAQFSTRHFTFEGSGGNDTDLVNGTVVTDRQRGSARYWSPTFCGVCTDEVRDNRNFLLKGSWFLSSPKMGSHDLRFGFDSFNDQRLANNHQSGSDYVVHGTTSILRDGQVYPTFNNNDTTIVQWFPIYQDSQGTNFRTHSVFLNDTWRLNPHFTLNLGLRYDRNDGKDSEGQKVANDAALSPRLAVNVDLKGDSRWVFNFSYGKYVTALANSIGDSASAGGVPANLQWFYRGPAINTDPNAPTSSLIPTDRALATVFDWFAANGGSSMSPIFASVPGLNTEIRGTLRSPAATEFAAGVTGNLGGRVTFRADAVYRRFEDFYGTRVDLSTGQVTSSTGQKLDMRVIENTDDVERRYTALNLQLGWRPHDRFSIGANWTISRALGNFNGETSGSGPVTSGIHFYPEYIDPAWNAPTGDLAIDQRHKLRLWMSYDLPVGERLGKFNFTVLTSYGSGTPYGAVGPIDPRPFVTNPGYATPPSSVDYFFTDRDAFRTEGSTSIDLAFNYRLPIRALGRTELFLEAQLLNLFNATALVDVSRINTSVLTRSNSSRHQRFNPFTEKPVEGVHWDYGPDFGKPTSRLAYQTPRTFRFSSGMRF